MNKYFKRKKDDIKTKRNTFSFVIDVDVKKIHVFLMQGQKNVIKNF